MYTLQKIAEITGSRFSGNGSAIIRNITTDSRIKVYNEDTLFFALIGIRHNGHGFISELYSAGVRCFVVSRSINEAEFPEASFIYTKNTLEALQLLVSFHRNRFHIPVIAVTGSNGKTVVKEWLSSSLSNNMSVVSSPKSYNSQTGVPLSVWAMNNSHNIAVFEAGISQPGEMEKLERILRPTIGVFTNIGEAHQENFESSQQKAYEKSRLFINCDMVVYNKDNPVINNTMSGPEFSGIKHITWSFCNNNATLSLEIIPDDSNGGVIIKEPNLDIFTSFPFSDKASVENAATVITTLFALGYASKFIQERLSILNKVEMRLEQKQGINNCTLINDSYNSDFGSLSIALDFLNQQLQNRSGTLILSDILQSGRNPRELYSDVADMVRSKNISRFIGIGPDLSLQKNLFQSSDSEFYLSTEDFLKHLPEMVFDNEAILVKGSRVFRFERIVSALEEKVHESVLEINLDTLVGNLNHLKSLLPPKTKIAAMVKAFSYGSGSYEIANILQYHRVDYLAVAFADEGKVLREKGITVPIMVMNPESGGYDQIIRYNLEPEIFSISSMAAFKKAVETAGLNNYPVHIKLDTGMHRLGFQKEEIKTLIQEISKSVPELNVVSIFSHLAAADQPELDDFTRGQITLFKNMSGQLISELGRSDIIRHILNSAGVERFPGAAFDMARVGIGLYGISAVNNGALKQVNTLKSTILQIKTINPGESVGYGRRHVAINKELIGIIPIGYADGLRRSLGNGRGRVIVNGKPASIIGNICMDMCMIDLSGIEGVKEGDGVIFFGAGYHINIITEQLETIPYEVLTSVSPRVKRVYYKE